MKRMIFHIPFAPDSKRPSGTNIRPLKMLQAFKNIGYDVNAIMGDGNERKEHISVIKKRISQGFKYDFVYAENHTLPTILTEKNHIPSHPILDYSFFYFCKKQGIPIGLFYRDVYWNFSDYQLKGIKAILTKSAYKLDLMIYNKVLDKLFLPSLEMLHYIPKKIEIPIDTLPPGHSNPALLEKNDMNTPLHVLYIGGIGNHYQMLELFKAIPKVPNVKFTLCVRHEDWSANKETYNAYINAPNLTVVHAAGKDLIPLYKKADIGLLFVEPVEYWTFAVPVKLFEYMGHHKPMITSKGTYANDFATKHDLSWSIDYKSDALVTLLNKLSKHTEDVKKKARIVKKIAKNNTWEKRAEKVVNALKKQHD